MAECYLSEIRPFAGKVLPANWQYCNGQLLRISDYQALFALLGTNFGGDGVSTFGLPDLRGRLVIGQGQGAGLTNRVLGQSGGSEQATVAVSQIPSHSHTFNVSSANANSNSPKGAVFANPQPSNFYGTTPLTGQPLQVLDSRSVADGGGSGLPHENRMPAMACNFIIATVGYYPSQN